MLQSAYPEIKTRVYGQIQPLHAGHHHHRIAGNIEDQTVWPVILSQSAIPVLSTVY